MKITIYQKPTCTTCRQVHRALQDAGVDFDSVNYYTDPLTARQLKSLLSKMGVTPRELLRKSEAVYKELGLATRDVGDAELIQLMATHPDLMQRPIVEKGDRAILARPAERLGDIL